MNIIVTMAGLGSRFKNAGYNCPKYMIEAKGKTLFDWAMMSLLDYNSIVNKYIFIVRKEDNSSEFIINHMFGFKIEIIEINELTDGQASTALIGVNICNEDEEILIYNIDTYVEPYELKIKDLNGDGSIPCFHAEGNHWSFVKEKNGKVIDVVEKKRISNNCSLGAYYFKSAKLYNKIYDEFYGSKKINSEKYIAPMYKFMINNGYEITYSIIDSKKVHVLGTPLELNEFINNLNKNYE